MQHSIYTTIDMCVPIDHAIILLVPFTSIILIESFVKRIMKLLCNLTKYEYECIVLGLVVKILGIHRRCHILK